MKSIREHLKTETTNIKSERAFIVSEFVKEINKNRLKTKYKPVTGRMIAIKTSHLSKEELRDFFKQCWRYHIEGKGQFSKCFFGALRIK